MAAAPLSSHAAVTVATSETFTGDNTNRATHTHTFDQVLSSDTVLLMVITGHDAATSGFSAIYDVGGTDQAMTQLGGLVLSSATADGDNAYATIFAIELGAAAAGDVDISWSIDSGTDRGTASFFQLAGATLAGVQTDSDTSTTNNPTTTTVSFTGLTAGSFVLAATGVNNNSASIDTVTGTPTPDATGKADEGAYNNGFGYTLNVTGDASITMTDAGTRDWATTGIAIAPIPEPASLALVGLGSLLMLSRSRRSR